MIGYYIVKFFSWLMCISPAFIRKVVAGFLGWIAVVVTPKWRIKMAIANIKDCLLVDDSKAEKIAKESLSRFGRMIVEVMRFPLLTSENIHKLVKFDGIENLEAAIEENRGIVMCTGHYGNWELLGGSLALHGVPMISITRKQNNGAMDRFINEYREMVGQKLAYNRGHNSLLAISKMLREKKCVGILYDQDTNDDGVSIELFGKKSIIPYGAAALSRTYGSPILPVFLHNNEDGTCTVKIHPIFHTPKTKDRESDFYIATKQLVDVLEEEIKADPSMWFWAHDRWKDGRERFGGKVKRKHRHHHGQKSVKKIE